MTRRPGVRVDAAIGWGDALQKVNLGGVPTSVEWIGDRPVPETDPAATLEGRPERSPDSSYWRLL